MWWSRSIQLHKIESTLNLYIATKQTYRQILCTPDTMVCAPHTCNISWNHLLKDIWCAPDTCSWAPDTFWESYFFDHVPLSRPTVGPTWVNLLSYISPFNKLTLHQWCQLSGENKNVYFVHVFYLCFVTLLVFIYLFIPLIMFVVY